MWHSVPLTQSAITAHHAITPIIPQSNHKPHYRLLINISPPLSFPHLALLPLLTPTGSVLRTHCEADGTHTRPQALPVMPCLGE